MRICGLDAQTEEARCSPDRCRSGCPGESHHHRCAPGLDDHACPRARVLFALDANAGQVDYRAQIGERVGVSTETVRLIAKRFVETGGDVQATIGRKKPPGPPVPSPVTGEVEARLIALACSTPPAGYDRWSLRLLEKYVVLVDDIPDLDHSTIGRVLKKRNYVLI